MIKLVTISVFLIFSVEVFSQEIEYMNWWNPAENEFPVVEGQGWSSELTSSFDRLPTKAESMVRKSVWELSHHSAGQMIRFRTNSERIIVRYKTGGEEAMNHMPATGVSGVDLYAIDSDGGWIWSRGHRNFSDTIVYDFSWLKPNGIYHDQGREYRLYLPLYNNVEWLEIGVSEKSYFKPLRVRKDKPIVVYGTSIAQGACASRPGMAWTNILSRKMDREIINLAFSGNGRLESEMIDLLKELDAKIYILDCLPNLTDQKTYSDEELTKRIYYAVKQLKANRPEADILLVDHAGYTDGSIDSKRLDAYQRVNKIQSETYKKLISEDIEGLYYLAFDEIGLQMDDMVDGTHPNDLGMMHYAEAYEKKLREIFKEPFGHFSTTKACTQYREPGNYDWEDRHNEILEMNNLSPPKTVILANSIVHFWGGLPKAKLFREENSWEEFFTPMGVRNLAYGWDRIENVLWRIYHGELDGYDAEKVIVMIGTNNLHLNTDDEILKGLDLIVDAIKNRQPEATIVMMGLLPRRENELKIKELNYKVRQLADRRGINYEDLGFIFLLDEIQIDENLFSDGLHPNKKGYELLRNPLKSIIEKK